MITKKRTLTFFLSVLLVSGVHGKLLAQKVAAGHSHNLLIKKDGSLWTWGRNENGQLGHGTTDEKSTPTRVGTDDNWQEISGGEAHSVAIRADGTLWAWGKNEFGRLGDGTTQDKNVPTQIGTDANWSKVSAGKEHTLSLKTDGTLWAWGRNEFGQLGEGTTEDKSVPMQVGTDTDWVAVSAGYYHTIALKSDGTLWIWGDNRLNYLGDENTVNCVVQSIANPTGEYVINFFDSYGDGWNDAAIKVNIDGVETEYTLDAGASGSATVSIPDGSDVLSFEFVSGDWDAEVTFTINDPNGFTISSAGPSPGAGTITLHLCEEGRVEKRTSPTRLNGDTDWLMASAGNSNSFAIKTNGSLWAWGANTFGQLGDGTLNDILFPTQVGSDTDWEDVMTSTSHVLAKKHNRKAWSWGANYSGQLGIGSLVDQPVPHEIAFEGNWSFVVPGAAHTLGLKDDGTLWSWGGNNNGQIGDGNLSTSPAPIQIGNDTDWINANANVSYTLAEKNNETLFGWGSNLFSRLGDGTTVNRSQPVLLNSETDRVKISSYRHVLLLKEDGSIWSWGENGYGQVGDETTTVKSTPGQVGEDSDWSDVFVGHHSSYALKADGTLWVWGRNNYGQLGDGTTTNKSTPTQIGTNDDWTQLSAGFAHVLAIKDNGTLWSWGYNDFGQLGDGTQDDSMVPIQIGTDSDWSLIQAGDFFSLAQKADGTLWSWGRNDVGQLGDGTLVNKSTPVQITSDTDWQKISAGDVTLVIKTDGSLWGWGNNYVGQLGDGTYTNRLVPTQIGTDNDWAHIDVGGAHNVAIKANGTLWAWGSNAIGRLGNGSAWKESPYQVKTVMDIKLSDNQISVNPLIATEVGTLSVVNESDHYISDLSLAAGQGDTDNGSFAISGDKLVTAVLDFNAKSQYSIRVQATDEFGSSFSKSFVISRPNQAPTDLNLSATETTENITISTKIATLTSVDPDENDTHTYSLVSGEGDIDNSSFAIEGDQLLTGVVFDFEAKAEFKVRIQATDALGAVFSKAFTIKVNDANDAPTDFALSKFETSENRPIGEELATLTTTDEDNNDTHTYAFVQGEGDTDNSLFDIVGNKLVVNGVFDFEIKPSLTIRVRTTDSDEATFSKSLTLAITNTNDAPSEMTLSANVISETLIGGKEIGELSVVDQDAGDTHTLSFVSGEGGIDNALFSLDGKKLVTVDAISGVKKDSYSVRVQARDMSDGLFSKSFTIIAQDIKSSQEISFSLPESVYPDESPITLVATATSGLPVTFEVVNGPAVIDGDKLTLEGAGAVEVKATQSGNDEFLSASITQALMVNPFLVLTVTVSKVDETLLSEGVARLFTSEGELVEETAVDEGAAQLTELKPGSYLLQVVPTGDATVAVSETYYPSAPSAELAEVIHLSMSTSLNMTMIDSPVAGLKDEAGQIYIFPNPVENELRVSIGTEGRESLEHVHVYSFAGTYVGEFVPKRDNQGIVLIINQAMKPGTYILKLEFRDGVTIGKFVKQ